MQKPAAIAVQHFRAKPEAVYDAILDEEMIARFMFGPLLREEEILHVRLDAKVGGAFSYKVRRAGVDIDHVGKFLELEKPTRIAFTWAIAGENDADPSTVEIDIQPTPEGCTLTLTHTMAPEWADFIDRARGAWEKMLGVLSTLVPPRPKVADAPDRIALIFIRANRQAVWNAVVTAAMSRQYFYGHAIHVADRPGGEFSLSPPDSQPNIVGTVLIHRPPELLRVVWAEPAHPDIPPCEVEWRITTETTVDGQPLTRLTVNEYHQNGLPARYVDSGRTGWAIILSGIKSLLETGAPLPAMKLG
jgi:uncharacterized protein YndB with AHSA1/START domain